MGTQQSSMTTARQHEFAAWPLQNKVYSTCMSLPFSPKHLCTCSSIYMCAHTPSSCGCSHFLTHRLISIRTQTPCTHDLLVLRACTARTLFIHSVFSRSWSLSRSVPLSLSRRVCLPASQSFVSARSLSLSLSFACWLARQNLYQPIALKPKRSNLKTYAALQPYAFLALVSAVHAKTFMGLPFQSRVHPLA